MKTFEELNKEQQLTRFTGNKFGTMYFIPNLPNEEKVIIRHLDGELTLDLLPAYIELYNTILEYIDIHSLIKKHVFMPHLIEVGKDYIIRPFYIYLVSTNRYFDPDEPLEPHKEYYEMINAFSEVMMNQFVMDDITDPTRESIIKRVLRKSLIQPRGKTFFEGSYINKYIVVEPAISLEDLEKWQQK